MERQTLLVKQVAELVYDVSLGEGRVLDIRILCNDVRNYCTVSLAISFGPDSRGALTRRGDVDHLV